MLDVTKLAPALSQRRMQNFNLGVREFSREFSDDYFLLVILI